MLRDDINNAVKEAMKAKEERKLSTLRMVNSTIKNADIDARGQGKPPLSDADLLGLFQGVGLPQQSPSDVARLPNLIWLYRRPILDYWAEHEETLGHIIRHVLIHEIGHHFGLSDADMEAIEAGAG